MKSFLARNERKKKLLITALSGSLIALVLVACFGLAIDSVNAAEGKYKIRVAFLEPTNDPFYSAMQVFKDLMERRSQGRVEVELYPSGQLGSSVTNMDQMASGDLEMAIIYYAYFTGYVPWVALADYPFAMPADLEQCWRIFDNRIVPATNEVLSKKGILMLSHLSTGGYKMWMSMSPIRTPADIKGKKYRAAATGVTPEMVKCWGGKPVVIPWPETFTGFEQGIFDMMDAPAPAGVTFHFYDVVKYITKCDLAYGAMTICVGRDWFNGLPNDIQDLIRQNVRVAADNGNAGRARIGAKVYEIFADKGVKVIYLTPEEKEAFNSKLGPLKDFVIKKYGQDKVDLFLKN